MIGKILPNREQGREILDRDKKMSKCSEGKKMYGLLTEILVTCAFVAYGMTLGARGHVSEWINLNPNFNKFDKDYGLVF